VSVRYTAFIPVRAGSKSIPLKNVKDMAGKPLVHWTLGAADACPSIGRIVVSTDGQVIEDAVNAFGSAKVEIHRRSAESASDTASTEAVMLEYARAHDDFENMILVQATSPLLDADDLALGIELYESGEYDSVLSVVRQKRFVWNEVDGAGVPANYDFRARPRRQDFDGFLVENGAFYIVSRAALLEGECRLSGRVGLCEMDEASYFEIDEPSDWTIMENLVAEKTGVRIGKSVLPAHADLCRIKALFTDCDGVMTDGGMYYSENGDELKKFTTRDGVGMNALQRKGLIVGIITSEYVELVRRRAAKLKLDELHMGVSDKMSIIREMCEKYSITLDEIAYIGDDVLDVPVIEAVGFGCSVADGMPVAKQAATYVTTVPGGQGAVREVAERILECLPGQ
jgi:N-acylneuraminate cytidylyltransferase